MKKIIALAVAAVVAAPAMADLTVSGTLAVGYSATDATSQTDAEAYAVERAKLLAAEDGVWTDAELAAVTALAAAKGDKGDAGFGVDTASVTFAGSEMLESGLTVSGSVTVAGLARSAASGEDAVLKVAGDFGAIEVGAKELNNGVYTYGSSVAENFTGELVGAASNADAIKYTAPAMGMVTLSVGYTEELGLGMGQDSDFKPDVNAAIKLSDALSGFVNYRFEGDVVGTQRTRFGAKYNAGVVVVSAAHEMYDDASDTTNTLFGIDVPMGATTFGLNYGINDTTSSRNGTSVGFKHALSSNVAVSGKYTKYETAGDDVTKSNLLVSLSF